jgi:spore coat protein CotF
MEMASHEAHNLQELALSCVNTLTNMALFLNQAKDPELKSLIQRQYSLHVLDYDIKADFLSKPEGTTAKLSVPELKGNLNSYTASRTAPQPVTPRSDIKELDDREIATAYLLTLKRAGREYAWYAMEASNPGIRAFLEDAFRMASAYNRSLIETSLDPLVTIAPDGRITDVNKSTETVTGYTREQLIGTDFSDYFTEPAKAQEGYRAAFSEGSVKDYPWKFGTVTGT